MSKSIHSNNGSNKWVTTNMEPTSQHRTKIKRSNSLNNSSRTANKKNNGGRNNERRKSVNFSDKCEVKVINQDLTIGEFVSQLNPENSFETHDQSENVETRSVETLPTRQASGLTAASATARTNTFTNNTNIPYSESPTKQSESTNAKKPIIGENGIGSPPQTMKKDNEQFNRFTNMGHLNISKEAISVIPSSNSSQTLNSSKESTNDLDDVMLDNDGNIYPDENVIMAYNRVITELITMRNQSAEHQLSSQKESEKITINQSSQNIHHSEKSKKSNESIPKQNSSLNNKTNSLGPKELITSPKSIKEWDEFLDDLFSDDPILSSSLSPLSSSPNLVKKSTTNTSNQPKDTKKIPPTDIEIAFERELANVKNEQTNSITSHSNNTNLNPITNLKKKPNEIAVRCEPGGGGGNSSPTQSSPVIDSKMIKASTSPIVQRNNVGMVPPPPPPRKNILDDLVLPNKPSAESIKNQLPLINQLPHTHSSTPRQAPRACPSGQPQPQPQPPPPLPPKNTSSPQPQLHQPSPKLELSDSDFFKSLLNNDISDGPPNLDRTGTSSPNKQAVHNNNNTISEPIERRNSSKRQSRGACPPGSGPGGPIPGVLLPSSHNRTPRSHQSPRKEIAIEPKEPKKNEFKRSFIIQDIPPFRSKNPDALQREADERLNNMVQYCETMLSLVDDPQNGLSPKKKEEEEPSPDENFLDQFLDDPSKFLAQYNDESTAVPSINNQNHEPEIESCQEEVWEEEVEEEEEEICVTQKLDLTDPNNVATISNDNNMIQNAQNQHVSYPQVSPQSSLRDDRPLTDPHVQAKIVRSEQSKFEPRESDNITQSQNTSRSGSSYAIREEPKSIQKPEMTAGPSHQQIKPTEIVRYETKMVPTTINNGANSLVQSSGAQDYTPVSQPSSGSVDSSVQSESGELIISSANNNKSNQRQSIQYNDSDESIESVSDFISTLSSQNYHLNSSTMGIIHKKPEEPKSRTNEPGKNNAQKSLKLHSSGGHNSSLQNSVKNEAQTSRDNTQNGSSLRDPRKSGAGVHSSEPSTTGSKSSKLTRLFSKKRLSSSSKRKGLTKSGESSEPKSNDQSIQSSNQQSRHPLLIEQKNNVHNNKSSSSSSSVSESYNSSNGMAYLPKGHKKYKPEPVGSWSTNKSTTESELSSSFSEKSSSYEYTLSGMKKNKIACNKKKIGFGGGGGGDRQPEEHLQENQLDSYLLISKRHSEMQGSSDSSGGNSGQSSTESSTQFSGSRGGSQSEIIGTPIRSKPQKPFSNEEVFPFPLPPTILGQKIIEVANSLHYDSLKTTTTEERKIAIKKNFQGLTGAEKKAVIKLYQIKFSDE